MEYSISPAREPSGITFLKSVLAQTDDSGDAAGKCLVLGKMHLQEFKVILLNMDSESFDSQAALGHPKGNQELRLCFTYREQTLMTSNSQQDAMSTYFWPEEFQLLIDDQTPFLQFFAMEATSAEAMKPWGSTYIAVQDLYLPFLREENGTITSQQEMTLTLFTEDEKPIGKLIFEASVQIVMKAVIQIQRGDFAAEELKPPEENSEPLQSQAVAQADQESPPSSDIGFLTLKMENLLVEPDFKTASVAAKFQIWIEYKGAQIASKSFVISEQTRQASPKKVLKLKVASADDSLKVLLVRVFEGSATKLIVGSAVIKMHDLFALEQKAITIQLCQYENPVARVQFKALFQPNYPAVGAASLVEAPGKNEDSKTLLLTLELGQIRKTTGDDLITGRPGEQDLSFRLNTPPDKLGKYETMRSNMFLSSEELPQVSSFPVVKSSSLNDPVVTGSEVETSSPFLRSQKEDNDDEVFFFQSQVRSYLHSYLEQSPSSWASKVEEEAGSQSLRRLATKRASGLEGDLILSCLFDVEVLAYVRHLITINHRSRQTLKLRLKEANNPQERPTKTDEDQREGEDGGNAQNAMQIPSLLNTSNSNAQPIFNFTIPPFNAGQQIQGKWRGGNKGSLQVDEKDEGEEVGGAELSYIALLKSIESSHPVNPQTKQNFGVFERVTVEDFYSRLLDALSCKRISHSYAHAKKTCIQCCISKRRKKFDRPKSLEDLPESDSSSSSKDGESISKAARALNEGSVLYLQTMKTLVVMFLVLTIFNIPIFLLYSDAGQDFRMSQFSDIFALFSFGMLGSTLPTCSYFSTHLTMERDSDLQPKKLKLSCANGSFIAGLTDLGFIYKRDQVVNRPATGEAVCHQVHNPTENVLDFYQLKEAEGLEQFQVSEEEREALVTLQINKSEFNIDTVCDLEGLWADPEAQLEHLLDHFEQDCYHKQHCELEFEDFNQKVSDACKERVVSSGILASEVVGIAQCSSDDLVFPMIGTSMKKEKIGIFLVIWNILSLLIVFHTFSKLKELNTEYLDFIDSETVQMEDFAIRIKNLQLPRYCQDPRIIQMKIWLHFKQILAPLATAHNLMEILDVNLSMAGESSYNELLRMQKIQWMINGIKQNVCARIYDEEQMTAKREEMDKLQERFNKLKIKYMNLTKQIIYDPTVPDVKLPAPSSQKSMAKRIPSIVFCFVVFKHCETKDSALGFFEEAKSFFQTVVGSLGLVKSSREKNSLTFLFKDRLQVSAAPSPTEILWANFSASPSSSRRLLAILASLTFFLLSIIIMMYSSHLTFIFEQRLPEIDCQQVIITKKAAYDDELSTNRFGKMECWCDTEVTTNQKSIWDINFKDLDSSDSTNYCLNYRILRVMAVVVKLLVDALPVLLVEVIQYLFQKLSQYRCELLRSKEQIETFTQIFFQEFSTLALIILIQSFDYLRLSDALRGVESEKDSNSQKIYRGFEPTWYIGQGEKLGYFVLCSGFISNSYILCKAIFAFYSRCKDRKYSLKLKKRDDDSDDDAPNTKQKIQQDLNALYTGPEFVGEKAFSRLMSILFVVLVFASGVPILYAVGFLYFLGSYLVQKPLLFRFFKKSSSLTRKVWENASDYLTMSLFFHLLIGLFMMTNPDVIDVNSNRRPESLLLDLEEQAKELSEAPWLKFMETRLQNSHQILYFAWVVTFIVLYFVGVYIKKILKAIFGAIAAVFKGIAYFFRMLAKHGCCKGFKVVCCAQKKKEVDVVMPELFSKRSLSKMGETIKKRYNVATVVETEGTKSAEAESKMSEGQQKDHIDTLNLMILQQSSKAAIDQVAQDELKQMQEYRTELLAEMRKKRIARTDFSDNLLNELSPQSLQMLHERAVVELSDFRNYFHWDKDLGEGPADPLGNEQVHIVFKELCYVNKMTTEQVLEFEFILQKRIYDIEDMIDHHFDLIRDYLDTITREQIKKKEEERRKKGGVELSFQQQITLAIAQEATMGAHPDLQFDDEKLFPYSRKCEMLHKHYTALIQADKDRRENRTCLQTICRLDSSDGQSYFTLDSPDMKIARRLYFQVKKEAVRLRELKSRAQRSMAQLKH